MKRDSVLRLSGNKSGSVAGESKAASYDPLLRKAGAQMDGARTSLLLRSPTLHKTRRICSRFEFWPGFVFYAPIFLYWAWQGLLHRSLTVPTIANPSMEYGGLCGESKVRLFENMNPKGRRWLAPYVSITRGGPNETDHDVRRVLSLAGKEGLNFPFVAKPDIGCQGAGVRVVRDMPELRGYVEAFPPQEAFLLQQLIDHEGEAGIFYLRRPGEEIGSIFSLTLKFSPYVRGDGVSSLEQLIRDDPRAGRVPHLYLPRLRDRLNWIPSRDEKIRLVFVGNHCKGSIFRNGCEFITPALTRRIDDLAKTIPDFYFGRFDVRFSSLAQLQLGKGFTVIEYNGGGSEATHIWDADTPLSAAYRDLFRQVRLLFEFGAANRSNGHKPAPWHQILGAWYRECRLKRRYPINQ